MFIRYFIVSKADSAHPVSGTAESDYAVVEANTFPELDWSIAKVLYKVSCLSMKLSILRGLKGFYLRKIIYPYLTA